MDSTETCEALGIDPDRLERLMRAGILRDVVMYGDKPWFRSIEVRQVARNLGRRL